MKKLSRPLRITYSLLSLFVEGEDLFLYSAGLLHKSGFLECRSKISKDRKVSLCINRRFKETSSLFPGAHNTSHDGPTSTKGHG